MTHARDSNPVRLRREELGLLLKELAEMITTGDGRNPAPMLSMIEGGYVPKRKTQVTIAAALRTTPEALWPEEYA
jgi:hypothetical protein